MAKKWIKNAIQRPGGLTAKAKSAGAVTKEGKIDVSWLEKATQSKNARTRKQANLAKTLKKLHK